MPVITGTHLTDRAVNRTLAASFFPLAQQWPFMDIVGSAPAYSLLEPFAIGGAVPQMSKFTGGTEIRSIPTYSVSVPLDLYSAGLEIDQTELESDQTGTLVKYAPALGVSCANTPWQVFASKLVKGASTNAAYQTYSQVYRGTTYYQTMDSLPVFSTAHTTWSGGTQSNLITGTLPNTVAALNAMSIPEQAKAMQADFNTLLSAIQQVRDTAGVMRYAHLEPEKHIVIAVPPCLRQAARLAFEVGDGFIQASTSVTPSLVKKVISSGYLAGGNDPADTNTALVPYGSTSGTYASGLLANATDWYAFVTNDYVMPWYWLQFIQSPEVRDDIYAGRFDASAALDAMMAKNASLPTGEQITVEAARQFASFRIDATFNKVGMNADYQTIKTRKFYVAGWCRLNLVPGPWHLSWKVKPASGY